MFVFACRINLLRELREEQRKLIEIPKDCEGELCGECHLQPGEVCDICGRDREYEQGPRCEKCGRPTKGEVALVDGQQWCHPCADSI